MKPIHLFAGVIFSSLSVMVHADPPDPQVALVQSLQDTVRELQREVDALKAQNSDHWLTEQRTEEIRALVRDILNDADTRASLLDSTLSAGYDGGFVIADDAGAFKLKINGQIQARYVWNNQDGSPPSGDTNRTGFEIRRSKLKFKGHVVDPSWNYAISGAFSRSGGAFALEDAYIRKVLEEGWSIQIGQFKSPLLREELISSSRQLAAERSLVNEEFNQDYSRGIKLEFQNDELRLQVMYSDGIGQGSLGFPGTSGGINTSALSPDTEFAFTGRGEWLVQGNWKQFKDFTSPPGSDFALMIGAAVHVQQSEFGVADDLTSPLDESIETDLKTYTIDATAKLDGASLFAAAVFRSAEAIGATDVDQSGFVAQGGYFFNDDWEGFVRYEFGDFDTPGIEDLSVITVGFNRYYASHSLKWTTDLTFGLNEINGVWATSGASVRADTVGEDGQIVFRTQFQLLF